MLLRLWWQGRNRSPFRRVWRIYELRGQVFFEVLDPWLSPGKSNSCFRDLRQTSEILCHGIY